MKENELLRLIASKANVTIQFKDEDLLPGTCRIDDVPMDIQIIKDDVVLNSIGKFQGDKTAYSKAESRGKGKFRNLCPHFKAAMIESGFKPVLWLLPLSPVWEDRYNLTEHEKAVKGCHFTIDL